MRHSSRSPGVETRPSTKLPARGSERNLPSQALRVGAATSASPDPRRSHHRSRARRAGARTSPTSAARSYDPGARAGTEASPPPPAGRSGRDDRRTRAVRESVRARARTHSRARRARLHRAAARRTACASHREPSPRANAPLQTGMRRARPPARVRSRSSRCSARLEATARHSRAVAADHSQAGVRARVRQRRRRERDPRGEQTGRTKNEGRGPLGSFRSSSYVGDLKRAARPQSPLHAESSASPREPNANRGQEHYPGRGRECHGENWPRSGRNVAPPVHGAVAHSGEKFRSPPFVSSIRLRHMNLLACCQGSELRG